MWTLHTAQTVAQRWIWRNDNNEPDDAMVCTRTNDGYWRHGDDFCSYGRLKEHK